jgi:UDP-N-acetylmuramyl pentapeptide phosphotransferase/UDP-N-acetylglucosamine-1-phosphate transferase
LNRSISVTLLAAVLSVMLVRAAIAVAHRRGTIDLPNERSSHSAPTPRGGGVGLVLAFLAAGLLSLGAKGGPRVAFEAPVVLAALAVVVTALVGWVDDHRGVAVRARLLVHGMAGCLILPLVAPLLPPVGVLAVLAAGWWALWVVSSINVVNFVDGIDGMIGLQALVFGVHCMLAGDAGGSAALFGALLAGASGGFLFWNWSPARIFLGDVGSGTLGVLFVIGGALLAREGRFGFVAAFLPLAPIFLDASVTLVARARRGVRLGEAHREHLYQRLANGGLGHPSVTVLYALAALGATSLAHAWPAGGLILAVPVVFGLGVMGAITRRAVRAPRSRRAS